jgi:hypothetical protein
MAPNKQSCYQEQTVCLVAVCLYEVTLESLRGEQILVEVAPDGQSLKSQYRLCERRAVCLDKLKSG